VRHHELREGGKIMNELSITGSVGRGGRNYLGDVRMVQNLLKSKFYQFGYVEKLHVDGMVGPSTIAAIEAFQRSVVGMNPPDGTVHPHGNTFAKLIEQQFPKDISSVNNTSYQLDNVTITHYDNCKLCCGKLPSDPAYGITADGTKATNGTVAADPMKIPMGARISFKYPDGTQFNGVVHDIGGGIKGNRIDIWVPTHEEALNKGKFIAPIVITPPKN
jgi:3D (Asp-Asp-Asp) domain-containing protein